MALYDIFFGSHYFQQYAVKVQLSNSNLYKDRPLFQKFSWPGKGNKIILMVSIMKATEKAMTWDVLCGL